MVVALLLQLMAITPFSTSKIFYAMGRLEQEFKQIDQLGTENGNGVINKLLVAALVIGVNLFSILRNPDPDAFDLEKLEGPLARFRIQAADENIVACRSSSCTVDTATASAYPDPIPTTDEQEKNALSDNVPLKSTPQYARARNQLLQVPATALIRDGKDTVVWLALGDLAVPLRVQEISRSATAVVITEVSFDLTRGLPISAANWHELGGNARSQIWLAAQNIDQASMNKLLRQNASVITAPDMQLHAGSRIRSKNHA